MYYTYVHETAFSKTTMYKLVCTIIWIFKSFSSVGVFPKMSRKTKNVVVSSGITSLYVVQSTFSPHLNVLHSYISPSQNKQQCHFSFEKM